MLGRWWKRTSSPTLQQLKKTILNEVINISVPSDKCENPDHNQSFKYYYCSSDSTRNLMCIQCINHHRASCTEDCPTDIREVIKEEVGRFEHVVSGVQGLKLGDEELVDGGNRVISTRSKVFDLFEEVLRGKEEVNEGMLEGFGKMEEENKGELMRYFSGVIGEKVNILQGEYQRKQYIEGMERIGREQEKRKKEFVGGKQGEFRRVMVGVAERMIEDIERMAGIERGGTSKSEPESGQEEEQSTPVTPPRDKRVEQWQQNVKLQNYISYQVEQIQAMRLEIEALRGQNIILNVQICQFQTSPISFSPTPPTSTPTPDQITSLKLQLHLSSTQNDRYSKLFLAKSQELEESRQQVERMNQYLTQMKEFYEGKRKGYKSQLLLSQNYQMKLENEFVQLQSSYDEATQQLDLAFAKLENMEELNQKLRGESPLRKSLSSTQLNHNLPQRSKGARDLQSKLISKFQKFWIAQIIQEYMARPVRFRTPTAKQNNSHSENTSKLLPHSGTYLVLAKTANDTIVGWLTPTLSLTSTQLFFNASKRKTFEWTRVGSIDPTTLGLQGDDGFYIEGDCIRTQNPALLSKALNLKGSPTALKLLRYEMYEVI